MPRWRVSLAEPALEDLRAIPRWTGENFGVRQITIYRNIIRLSIETGMRIQLLRILDETMDIGGPLPPDQ